MTEQNLFRTPLYERHVTLGGKIVPFAGFEMPVQYPTGIRAEHQAVREAVGLFDVSHMGEFRVSGPDALALVQGIAVNDASTLAVGQVQYSAMCAEDGGIVDDLTVLRFADHFILVVNASRRPQDWAFVSRHAEGLDVILEDRSDELGLLALQGPKAPEVLARVMPDLDLDALGYYHHGSANAVSSTLIVARMGYTGEDGFEIYVPADRVVELWDALLEAGQPEGILPAGLGARDSLRLEVGFALYGNDLDEHHTPLESRLAWVTKLDRADFSGRAALAKQKEEGVTQRLVGLRLIDKGFPRAGYPIVHDGETVGTLTSGTVSPTLGYGIAMGRVPVGIAALGTELFIDIRGKQISAVIARPPFYTEGSVKR
jgi:glycine cleavage system T protein (aminomethyltransferase)